ncbi:hypothetical protein MCBRY_001327 [Methylocystis bryophila]
MNASQRLAVQRSPDREPLARIHPEGVKLVPRGRETFIEIPQPVANHFFGRLPQPLTE